MKNFIFTFILILLSFSLFGQDTGIDTGSRQICIEWNDVKPVGDIELLNGRLTEIKITKGIGKAEGNGFKFSSPGNNRISLSLDAVNTNPGPGVTLVTVNTQEQPFSFFLRDINKEFPVYIPEYGVVVLDVDDGRSYTEVETDIKSRKLISKLQQIENEPEESFETVKDRTRDQTVPIWLGISRDIRIFQISQNVGSSPLETDVISVKNSSTSLTLPETNNSPVNYLYIAGRGQGVESTVKRRLEDGVLPILHSEQVDGEINYHSIAFASLESLPLNEETPIGTHFMVADNYSGGHMFTDKQQEIVDRELKKFRQDTSEQTVLYCRIIAKNTGSVPRYAWYKTPRPGRSWSNRFPYTFDQTTGFSAYTKDRLFCISKLNGKSLPNEEVAILLKPGETATFDFIIPHSPVSRERAILLSGQSFENRYTEAKKFWQTKLDNSARIHLPEKRIDEMVRAGLLHLDLITYGNEPDGTLAPIIGVYSPIGTESSPIMQFYCSMGLNDIAKRSLMYFLDKQHEDGFIQNFNGYMSETGAALWSMGEYFRYSNDVEWVKTVKSKLIKSCDYLINWRDRNKKEELKGKGYGMIDGKFADIENPNHLFTVNAYGYIGLSRVAEMLKNIDPVTSGRLGREAENWKQDILASFNNSMAHSPVVPLGDGTWCPTAASWAGAIGPSSLFVNNGTVFSHGHFSGGANLYLVFCEVLEPNEQASKMMLNYYSELFYSNNAAFSQPYYSRHDWVQLKQGLVKPFLKTYYNTFSALADRETYTFWEHIYQVSPHKTHEEAWFLMQTRWMLYMEEGQNLKLLRGVPRAWLENGKTIDVKNIASYFGPLSFNVKSNIEKGFIEATVDCNSDRKPNEVTIRIPHPNGKKAVKVAGGEYDPETETVTVRSFNGNASVRIEY